MPPFKENIVFKLVIIVLVKILRKDLFLIKESQDISKTSEVLFCMDALTRCALPCCASPVSHQI